jgi:uncharacterized protein (UPF0264 family)
MSLQRLLVSVRGPKEAIEAAAGGACIADVEFPTTALGTPYPLNILSVRNALNKKGFQNVLVSTNIGEKQMERSSACQAALGVATAGADLIKCGFAEMPLEAACYLGRTIARTVRKWYPKKRIYPAVFVDKDLRRYFDPFGEGPRLAKLTKADGLLLDTYNKSMGKGLLDYCSLDEIETCVKTLHKMRKEAWIAGSIAKIEMSELWATGVDVICIRGAACQKGKGNERFGEVKKSIIAQLISTLPH